MANTSQKVLDLKFHSPANLFSIAYINCINMNIIMYNLRKWPIISLLKICIYRAYCLLRYITTLHFYFSKKIIVFLSFKKFKIYYSTTKNLNFKILKVIMSDRIAVSITFDDNNSIRVLDSEKFKETDNIRSECNDFLKSNYC